MSFVKAWDLSLRIGVAPHRCRMIIRAQIVESVRAVRREEDVGTFVGGVVRNSEQLWSVPTFLGLRIMSINHDNCVI